VYILTWNTTYHGREKKANEIVVVETWNNQLAAVQSLNSQVIADLVEQKQQLVSLATRVEEYRAFQDEFIFLVTDSAQTLAKSVEAISAGEPYNLGAPKYDFVAAATSEVKSPESNQRLALVILIILIIADLVVVRRIMKR
jgi:hypothetical protein